MIRRFLSIGIFCGTVLLAAFGQNVFNRDDLVYVAHNVQQQAPKHMHTTWVRADKALAALVTEAGPTSGELCYIDDYHLYRLLYVI